VASSGWFGRLWRRLFGGKPARRGLGIPAPETLVARVSAVEEAREHEMLRLAEESIRRGHPEQAAIVYRKAAVRYRREGLAQKELAVLHMWARIAPEDPAVWTGMAQLHEAAGKTRAALEALARAAALHRRFGQEAAAEAAEAHMESLRPARPSQDLPPAPGAPALVRGHTGLPSAAAPSARGHTGLPAATPARRAPSAVDVDLDGDGPLELDMPVTGHHEAVDDEVAQALLQRVPARPRSAPTYDEPERLPTGALEALDDDEPERLPTGALEALDDEGLDPDELAYPGPAGDPTYALAPVRAASTEGGLSPFDLLHSEPTDGGLDADDLPGDSDDVDPAVLEALAREAEEEAEAYRAEEGGATIAMPALGGALPPVKRRFNIPEAATVMDTRSPVDDGLDDDEEVTPAPELNQTRAYSAAEIQALLKDRKR
jgi:hypothetical protein